MAGTDPRFNADAFRSAIKFAMSMGKPGATQDQLVFAWSDRNTYTPGGPVSAPFNWTQSPQTSLTHGPVTVPGAYEMKFRTAQAVGTPIGQFDQPTLIVTLLDADYPLIFDPEGVRADLIKLPNKAVYEISFVAPPEALFDVTIYTVYAQAVEQS